MSLSVHCCPQIDIVINNEKTSLNNILSIVYHVLPSCYSLEASDTTEVGTDATDSNVSVRLIDTNLIFNKIQLRDKQLQVKEI